MRYFNPDCEQITQEEWVRLFTLRSYDEDKSWWVVGKDTTGDVHVSTVWTGISISSNEPMVYETMISREDADEEIVRYSSRQEAEAGHVLAVAASELEAGYRSKMLAIDEKENTDLES